MNVNVRDLSAEKTAKANRRAQWMRQLRQWHWISGAVSLVSMLLFSITGITLNHSSLIEAKPEVTTRDATIGASAIEALTKAPRTGRAELPADIAAEVTRAVGVEDTVLLETHQHDVQAGDVYLMCSDGLSDMLDDASIGQVLQAHDSLESGTRALIDAANDAGGKDNISVILVRASGGANAPARSWWPFRR